MTVSTYSTIGTDIRSHYHTSTTVPVLLLILRQLSRTPHRARVILASAMGCCMGGVLPPSSSKVDLTGLDGQAFQASEELGSL